MRTLSNFINDEIIINGATITEAIKIGKDVSNISVYTCQPKDKKELKDIIQKRIKSEGFNCDLNDIDTSLITDMSELFMNSNFNGDISLWDVSKVKTMAKMFAYSDFNGDISDWDVSNIDNMYFMFCGSNFNQNISNWKINNECYTRLMFIRCPIREEYKPKSLQKK